VATENPGLYEPYVQTEAWPFLPAFGLVVAAILFVAFLTVLGLALKREAPAGYPLAAGGLAALVAIPSVIGVIAASSDFAANEAKHWNAYVDEVGTWIGEEIDEDIPDESVRELLAGVTVEIEGDEGRLVLELIQVRTTNELVLQTS
jgi:hypothetical protein